MPEINLDNIQNAGLENVHDDGKINLSEEKIDVIAIKDERKQVKLSISDYINIGKCIANQKALEYLGAEPVTGTWSIYILIAIIVLLIFLGMIQSCGCTVYQ